MHVLNRIIQRSYRQDDSEGLPHFLSRFFVSCSCQWFVWAPSESEGEDQWIDHMETEIIRNAQGEIVGSIYRS